MKKTLKRLKMDESSIASFFDSFKMSQEDVSFDVQDIQPSSNDFPYLSSLHMKKITCSIKGKECVFNTFGGEGKGETGDGFKETATFKEQLFKMFLDHSIERDICLVFKIIMFFFSSYFLLLDWKRRKWKNKCSSSLC